MAAPNTDATRAQAQLDTAIVIGSGMAGLAAAQVLSANFSRVLVLERDSLADADAANSAVDVAKRQQDNKDVRPGVSQYKQLHAMLPRGLREFDTIFQGRYSPALIAGGANIVDLYQTYLLAHPNSGPTPWLRNSTPTREPQLTAIATRHLFETTARRLVAESSLRVVEFVTGATVSGLLFEGGGADGGAAAAAAAGGGKGPERAVRGVRLSDGSCLRAQLVVDCSGRGSNLPAWLAAAGYPRPRTSRVGCNTGYCSWFCKLAPEVDAALRRDGVFLFTALPSAPVRTFTLAMRTEAGWLVGVGGNEGVYPRSSNPEDLVAFAKKEVWHPAAGGLLAGSTPLTPACVKTGLGGSWRHYENMQLPDGLLVLGDSQLAMNPQYGQGMTVAAIEAVALQRLLRSRQAQSSSSKRGQAPAGDSSSSSSGDAQGPPLQLQGLHQELQKAVLPTMRLAWQLAAGGDLRYPSATSNEPATGLASLAARVVAGYFDVLFCYAGVDAAINEQVLRVTAMTDDPSTLLAPSMLGRVLCHWVGEHAPAPIAAAAHSLGAWLSGSSHSGKKGVGGGHRCSDELLRILGVCS